ncbi:MAG: ASPIC/UnbV domain-containing protein, partial [Planctomycetales bacterium]|nr:ASPIC/UnbV domain-containing protein [Planctomycetales bacterium]
VLVVPCGKPARLLRNDQQLGHHWLRFQLIGNESNPDAIGAWVEVRAGGQTQYRQVMPTRSYQSQVELPVTIGLGTHEHVESVRVRWPNGKWQDVLNWRLDAVNHIHETAG